MDVVADIDAVADIDIDAVAAVARIGVVVVDAVTHMIHPYHL